MQKTSLKANPGTSWKERIKGFCLYQQEENEMPEETFSLGSYTLQTISPTCISFLSSFPMLLRPSNGLRGKPTNTLVSVLLFSEEAFSLLQHQAGITQPQFFFAFL